MKTEQLYKTRFVPERLTNDLVNLYHLANVYCVTPYERMLWAAKKFHERHRSPDLIIRYEGYCGHSGKVLTVPESIDRGIGPECAKRLPHHPSPQLNAGFPNLLVNQ
jgi:hypothetical protein